DVRLDLLSLGTKWSKSNYIVMPMTLEHYSLQLFFFHDTATTEPYTLSLHDALPIFVDLGSPAVNHVARADFVQQILGVVGVRRIDRKSTRLNSSHVSTSYAVFCLKKKNQLHFSCTSNCTKVYHRHGHTRHVPRSRGE